ncbi:uncharacterized protein [Rutidosis leptorrhynchoides]|uniref:uncharacterized protein n=1 Tax=Rutidosis leptorrhynchoides TaxID=125765 RepID=UPI003A99F3A0
MKILSLNIRGFGKKGAFGWVKNLCSVEKPDILALQETKCKEVNDFWFIFEASMKSDFFIAIRGKWKQSQGESYIVNVYGPHADAGKIRLWDALDNMARSSDSSWLLCRDFNEVRDEDERFNSVYIPSRVHRFNDFTKNNGLVEIPLGGRKFTKFSDHCPIALRDKLFDFGPKPFRFFDEWLNKEEVNQIIMDAWSQDVNMSRKNCVFRNKLKNVKAALKA